MPKVKWKTPEPGQVELELDGGRPFVGPEVTILAPWVHDLKIGDLITSKTIQTGKVYGFGRNISPLPFLTPSYGMDEQINPGDVGLFLGTMRTNENNSRGSIPFRMDRYIVLFGAKKYFILNFNYFEPVAE
jgi:hypothetical protein